jgi:PEGA domain
MHLRRTVPVAGLLATLAWSAPAWTQPAKAPREAASEAMTEQARKLYLEGVKAFAKERWAEARAAFLGALALHYHYTTVGNLGSAELRLGQHRSAAQHLAEYVRQLDQDPAATPKERFEGRAELDKARARVGSVVVHVDVDGATITRDGDVLGVTPLADPLFIEPGAHLFLVKRDGYDPQHFNVRVAPGEETSLDVSLAPGKREPNRPRSSAQATTPLREKHEPMRETQEPDRGPRTALLLGGASTAGAAAVAGVVFTILAVNKGNDAEAQRDAIVRDHGADACSNAGAPAECAALSDTFDTHVDLKSLAFWSFAGAGVVGVGTLIYGLATRTGGAEKRLQITPLIGPSGAGLSLGGRL